MLPPEMMNEDLRYMDTEDLYNVGLVNSTMYQNSKKEMRRRDNYMRKKRLNFIPLLDYNTYEG